MRIVGVSASFSSSRMRRMASMPSICGIFQSMSTSRNGLPALDAASSSSIASLPELETVASIPSDSSMCWRISRDAALSSTTNARLILISLPRSATWLGEASPIGSVMSKLKVLPLPNSLVTPMLPSIRSTRSLLIARPRPVPPYFRVVDVSACANGVKSASCCSFVRPIPVSRTLNLR